MPSYSEAQIRAFDKVFKLVQSKNWKDPIRKRVWLNNTELALLEIAIPYYTGSVMYAVRVIGGRIGEPIPRRADGRYQYLVRAAGYYACIGA